LISEIDNIYLNKILKYSSILFLFLYLGQVVEKAIPHSHHENEGIITLNFSDEKDHSDHEHENSEKLHSTFHQLNSVDLYLDNQFYIQLFTYKQSISETTFKICYSDYNIFPKVLNSILFIIHIHASKAPPSF
tara:strand:+ start:12945 stop:13343 length:399 start_codon:yes stop_codon:yes gene_type:complete